MLHLEPELQALKENLLEMMEVVTSQLLKCHKSLVKSDQAPAKEVLATEKRVNALELAIDKDCENILALYNPVASDLRFVLASLKIGNDLERIGDNAKGLANFLASDLSKKERKFIGKSDLEAMLDIAIGMLSDMRNAVNDKDTGLAMKVIKRDAALNQHGKEASKQAIGLIKENPDQIKLALKILGLTRRIERVGDLVKNIGEELMFYVEAKVIKHKKSKAAKKGKV